MRCCPVLKLTRLPEGQRSETTGRDRTGSRWKPALSYVASAFYLMLVSVSADKHSALLWFPRFSHGVVLHEQTLQQQLCHRVTYRTFITPRSCC